MINESDKVMIREAFESDRSDLLAFLDKAKSSNKHLDWNPVISWLGKPSFLICYINGIITSILVCNLQNGQDCWIRVFQSLNEETVLSTWHPLLERLLSECRATGGKHLFTIPLTPWFSRLLENSGFACVNHIINFSKHLDSSFIPLQPSEYILRAMLPGDFLDVLKLDHLAFQPLWHLSMPDLASAHGVSAYSAVLESNKGAIIGYILASFHHRSGHISRIAIHPEYQNHKLARQLLNGYFNECRNVNVPEVTVNTSTEHLAAIQLYCRMGFEKQINTYLIYDLQVT